MKISGFTILRNGESFDYPYQESLSSLLPLVDELIVSCGDSTDNTTSALEAFVASRSDGSKVKLIHSKWNLGDKTNRRGGQILAEQTNLALQGCTGDWCVYLQADEVLHEADLATLRSELTTLLDCRDIDALVLNYRHFYAGYDIEQYSRSAYRREIRVVRNGVGITSIGDAQSFRYQDHRKIPSALSKAHIYHYGWVKPQQTMQVKTSFMDTLYHPQAKLGDQIPATGDNYIYKRFVGLRVYKKSHPSVMQKRIKSAVKVDLQQLRWVFNLKDLFKVCADWLEGKTGHRLFEYKNYILKRRF